VSSLFALYGMRVEEMPTCCNQAFALIENSSKRSLSAMADLLSVVKSSRVGDGEVR
jgi:hypothetical protein